jgi:hypothetical protein
LPLFSPRRVLTVALWGRESRKWEWARTGGAERKRVHICTCRCTTVWYCMHVSRYVRTVCMEGTRAVPLDRPLWPFPSSAEDVLFLRPAS